MEETTEPNEMDALRERIAALEARLDGFVPQARKAEADEEQDPAQIAETILGAENDDEAEARQITDAIDDGPLDD